MPFANRWARYSALLSLLCVLCLGFSLSAQDEERPVPEEVLRLGRGTINALDWSADGEMLAVATSNGMWLLDADLQPLNKITSRSIQSAAFSPDGTLLAFGSTGGDCRLIIWSLASNERTTGKDLCADELVWSPDSEKLATINVINQSVEVLDLAADSAVRLPVPGLSVVWSPDASQIAVGTDKGLFIVDATTNKVTLARVAIGRSDVVAWADDEIWQICNQLDTSRNVSSLCAVDAETGDQLSSETFIWRHPGERSEMRAFNWQAGRFSFVLTNQQAGELPFLHVYNWTEDNRISFITRGNLAAWKPDETTLTIAADNGVLQNINADTEAVLQESLVFTAPVASVTWSPDSSQIASVSSGDAQYVRLWDMDAHTLDPLASTPTEHTVQQLDWGADGLLGTGRLERDGVMTDVIKAWPADLSQVLEDNTAISPVEETLLRALSHDLSRMAQSEVDTHIVTIADELTLETAAPVVKAIVWIADDSQIATMSSTPEPGLLIVEVWDSTSGERISTSVVGDVIEAYPDIFWDDAGSVYAIALRTRSADPYAIQVFDATTGIRLFEYVTPQYYWPKTAWKPDSSIIAIETLSEIVFVDVASGQPYLDHIPVGYINDLDWSPDGTLLAGANGDGTIRVWDVSELHLPE